jgi:hypothetical protein
MSVDAMKAADAVVKYAEWCGGVHDDGCPEDDTCDCSGKWINDGVTDAVNCLRQLAEASQRIEALQAEVDRRIEPLVVDDDPEVAQAIRMTPTYVLMTRAAADGDAAVWRGRCDKLKAERDEYKALASIGKWHDECRPNRHMAAETIQKQQAVIDKLADTITQLRAEGRPSWQLRNEP